MAPLPSRQTRGPARPLTLIKLKAVVAGGLVGIAVILLTFAVCPLIAKAMGFTAAEALRYAELMVQALTVLGHIHLAHLVFLALITLLSWLSAVVGFAVTVLVVVLPKLIRR